MTKTLIERAQEAGCTTAADMAHWIDGYEAGMKETQDQVMALTKDLEWLNDTWTPSKVTHHTNKER